MRRIFVILIILWLGLVFFTVCAQGETGNARVILTYPLNGVVMGGDRITVTGTAYDPDNDQGVKNVAVAIKTPDNKYLQSTGGFSIHPTYFPVTTGDGFKSWKSEIPLSNWLSRGVVYTVVAIVNDGQSAECTDPGWTFISGHTDSKGVNINGDVELGEANLEGAVLSLELINMTFADSIQPDDFILHSNISSLAVKNVIRENNSRASLVLDYDGSDFDEDSELSVTVKSSALKNWNNLTSNTLHIRAAKERITISAGEQLVENLLDGAVLNIQLHDVTFRDEEICADNILLVNGPEGLSVAQAVYQSPTTAAVHLKFNHTDFDSDITDFSLVIRAGELSQGSDLNSNPLPIKAIVERSEKQITGFTVPAQAGQSIIDPGAYTVTFRVPYGTEITSLAPNITVSEGAAVSPAPGEPQDFSQPVTYVVTAEDLSTQSWVVTCIVELPAEIDDNNENPMDDDKHTEDYDNLNNNGKNNNKSDNDGNKTTSTENTKPNDDSLLRATLNNTGRAVFSLTGRPEGKATFSVNLIHELGKNNIPLIIKTNSITVELPSHILATSLLEQALNREHAYVAIKVRELLGTDEMGTVTGTFTANGRKIAAIGCKMIELSVETSDGSGDSGYSTKLAGLNGPILITFDISSLNLGTVSLVNLSGISIDNEAQLKPILLGGTYDEVNKKFTFYSDRFSILTVGQVENLIAMNLWVGNKMIDINGILREIDVPPFLINNRVMVPLRFIGEALGAKLKWDEKTGTVIIKQGMKELKLVPNQPMPDYGIPATIIKGRTLVPVRYIAESFGAHVIWIPHRGTVYIVQ